MLPPASMLRTKKLLRNLLFSIGLDSDSESLLKMFHRLLAATERIAAERQSRRPADILVRSNTRTLHGSKNCAHALSAPPCCGQECPRAGAVGKTAREHYELAQYERGLAIHVFSWRSL